MCKTAVAEIGGSVAAVEHLSDSSIELNVDLDDAAALVFLPGQYNNIEEPGSTEAHSYSFSSRTGEKRASFLIRRLPDGLMSNYLAGPVQAGDRLILTGPLGSFYLREVKRPVLMLAGGTGLAPFLSMLALLAERGCEQPVHMVYGVNRDFDLVKLEQLDEFAATLKSFSYATCVVDEGSTHPRKGYVTHHMTPEVLHGGNVDVYLCGPPPMVDAVRHYFREQDITPASFHYEKFSPTHPTHHHDEESSP
jgi:benzoate/toluate 1,2-dioxygenase reductase subunit